MTFLIVIFIGRQWGQFRGLILDPALTHPQEFPWRDSKKERDTF